MIEVKKIIRLERKIVKLELKINRLKKEKHRQLHLTPTEVRYPN